MSVKSIIAKLDEMKAKDAPEFLRAHLVCVVLLPKLLVEYECIRAASESLGQLMTQAVCSYTGTCMSCTKADAVEHSLCVKCLAEADQIAKEIDDA
jgi:hypothetical protein